VADRVGFPRHSPYWDHQRRGARARWLAHEADVLGVEVTSEVFALDRLDPAACHLELNGEHIPGVPAFDPPATGVNGVTGTLSLREQDEAILVAKFSTWSVYAGEYERLRRDTAHRALVIICARPGMRAGVSLTALLAGHRRSS
jgi:hypothetical protein